MPQDPASLLVALLNSASIDDHEETLQAANAALDADGSDELAHRTRVVALLNLDRYDDVSRIIAGAGSRLKGLCTFEEAYALYKLGRLDEATKVLAAPSVEQRGLSHLAAQIAYRAERFDEARAIYDRLLAADPESEANDIRINSKAVQAQAEWAGTATPQCAEREASFGTFEPCYNAACISIAQGLLEQASELLERALALCDASDAMTDDDKEEERKAIQAQQAFVLAQSGDLDGARAVYASLQLDDKLDADLRLIASNNSRALDQLLQNPFEVEAEAVKWTSMRRQAKLFEFQSRILTRNCTVIDLHAQKFRGTEKKGRQALRSTSLPSSDPDINNTSIMGIAAKARSLSGKSLLKYLLALVKKQPLDSGPVLLVIHLYLQSKNVSAALNILNSFFFRLEEAGTEQCLLVRFSPGLVALAVSLRHKLRRKYSAKLELTRAAEFWQKRSAGTVGTLLTEAAIELASSSCRDDLHLAANTFTKLHQDSSTSAIPRAGLVAATATKNVDAIKQFSAELPSVESLIGDIDVHSLIHSAVPGSGSQSTSKKRSSDDGPTGERPAKKRSRKRLPKTMVPGQVPDPERWLPLRDRASYRPKGKKGRKKAADTTQGGLAKEEETLGLVGGGGVKVEKASSGPSQKKKKKGKK